MEMLSPRQQSILNRVVDAYIETAQPVGSRSITKLYQDLYLDSYSPATVRNEMGFLERSGYLTHPHPSAGRIPTDRGYRYYVDHGLREESFSQDFFHRLAEDLSGGRDESESFAEKASEILSEVSEEVSLLLVLDQSGRRHKLIIQGASRMLEKPEFQDIKKIAMILKVFEGKGELKDWLLERICGSGVWVSIGQENHPQAFWECAVISTPYGAAGKKIGTLALVGPRRMRYARNIPLVERMGRMLGNLLEEATDGR